MKTNDVFPSKFLKAEDDIFDNGAEVIATIKDVVKEKMGRGDEEKPVMYFKELPKGFVVNKTNWSVIEKLLKADDSDDWIGEKIALTTMEVDSFGGIVRAIRVKPTKPVADKAALIKRFTTLFEEARNLKVEGYENYSITPDMPDSEIIELGKELKAKIEAAKAF